MGHRIGKPFPRLERLLNHPPCSYCRLLQCTRCTVTSPVSDDRLCSKNEKTVLLPTSFRTAGQGDDDLGCSRPTRVYSSQCLRNFHSSWILMIANISWKLYQMALIMFPPSSFFKNSTLDSRICKRQTDTVTWTSLLTKAYVQCFLHTYSLQASL
jgi:hypothetical protein